MNSNTYTKYLFPLIFIFTPFVVYGQQSFDDEVSELSNAYAVTMVDLATKQPDLYSEVTRAKFNYDYAKEKKDNTGYEESIKALTKILNKIPDNFYVAYVLFNQAYTWGKEFKDVDKLNEAETYLKKLDILSPSGWPILYYQSDILNEIAVIDKKTLLLGESIDILYDICDEFPTDTDLKNTLGVNLVRLGVMENRLSDYKDEILASFMKCEKIKKGSGSYNIACFYSLLNDKENAFKWFEIALKSEEKENMDRDYILKDTDFKNLRTDERFLKLVNKYRPK